MPFTRLIAVVLLLATTGCAATPLFSRKDEDEGPLDPRSSPTKSLKDAETASARNGEWNVIRDADQAAVAAPSRPPVQLPVSELVARAEAAVAQQRLPQAKQHCEAILLQQPTNPRAHHLLARISDDEGQWGNAEHHYQLALQTDPNNADIVNDLGYSYLMQGRLPLAQQYLQQALQLNPTHQVAAGNLADLYSRRGDMQSAYRVLSTVLPPPDVERTLAQLFPGAPLHATMNPATAVPPQIAATNPTFDDAMPQTSALPSAGTNAPEYQSAMVVAPGINSPMAVMAPPATSSIPNATPYSSQYPSGQPAFGGSYADQQRAMSAQIPPRIEQTAATEFAPSPSGAATAPAPASSGPRRWPPAIWPPESSDSPVTQAAGVSPASPQRSSSGVTYLLPRRPSTSPNAPVSPFPPSGLPPANALPQSITPNPPRQLPNGTVSQFENPAQYASGPGASRIVTWSNQNGQSLESPPLPPTDEELHAAAAMGLNGAAAPPSAVMRTSPGSASGWNGGFYPPPQRQLPGSTGSIYDYPQQGAPLRATAPGTAGTTASASANEPHAGFVIAPNTALPENPLAGFEADRRQYDQQFQQQIDQSYAQSPSGYIRPPSESIPVPTYEVPAQSQPAMTGPPLTPNGTPWPGRSADGAVPEANTTNSAPQAAANGLVTPLPYRSQQSSAPAVAPPAYNRPAQPAASPDPFDAAGPRIIPGPSSW